ncbi:MAG: hypothetical protein HQK92_09455 [Nitrospirae bacterium]|nr:hypothetical protein [Nitrospirota bacterium]
MPTKVPNITMDMAVVGPEIRCLEEPYRAATIAGIMMDVIYFFYGLSLFIMGTGIIAQHKTSSSFKIGRIIWLLGIFGILHGITEWIHMWEFVKGPSRLFDVARWTFLISSYFFLLDFGLRMCLNNLNTHHRNRRKQDI